MAKSNRVNGINDFIVKLSIFPFIIVIIIIALFCYIGRLYDDNYRVVKSRDSYMYKWIDRINEVWFMAE